MSIVFDIGSNYNYHFIIEKLIEELERKFTCLRLIIEKYITFSVPIENEVARTDQDGKEITKILSYLLQFINSTRFMASSLSNLANNLA